jgi:hypothetical protein
MTDLPSGRDGVFRSIGIDVHTGRRLEVALFPDGAAISRRTIPEAAVEQLKADAALSRERHPKGYLIGNTQRHRVPLFGMPHALKLHLEARLGPYAENKAKWRATIAAEYPALLLSGYRS